MEGGIAELRIGALELAGRARESPGHDGEREPPPVVTRDEDPREQVQPATLGECVRTHIPHSDRCLPDGTASGQLA